MDRKKTSVKSVKRRVFNIIQIGSKDDVPSRLFDFVILIAIITNILMMILETFDALAPAFPVFRLIEVITVLIFFVEYVLRIWTAEYLYPQKTRGKAIRAFVCSFEGIIDLLTILPFYFLTGFVAFRMLRVVRILHLFRINSVYDSFSVITSVLEEKKKQLLFSLFIIFVLMIASSLLLYSVEHDAQPDAYSDVFAGLWWSVSALLTVGYGDIYPITVAGRIFAIITAMLGVGAVAIPTGIISAGFVEHYARIKEAENGEQTSFEILGISMIRIHFDSAWIGMSVEQIFDKYGITVVSVRRGGDTIRPDPGYLLACQDMVSVYKDPDRP